MLGTQILKQETNSAYWLMGPNEDNFAGLLTQESVRWTGEDTSPPHDSFGYWEREFNHAFVVSRWHGWGFAREDGLEVLAAWWDQWQWVGATLYPLYRYHDKVFPRQVREDLTALLGEMVNRRYELCGEFEWSEPRHAETLELLSEKEDSQEV